MDKFISLYKNCLTYKLTMVIPEDDDYNQYKTLLSIINKKDIQNPLFQLIYIDYIIYVAEKYKKKPFAKSLKEFETYFNFDAKESPITYINFDYMTFGHIRDNGKKVIVENNLI